MTAPEAFTSKLRRSQKKFFFFFFQYLTRMYFTIKKLGVTCLVGVPATSEVAYFVSTFLENCFLRQRDDVLAEKFLSTVVKTLRRF